MANNGVGDDGGDDGGGGDSKCPQTVTLIYPATGTYPEFWNTRIANYTALYPHIQITLIPVEEGAAALQQRVIEDAKQGYTSWDGAFVPAQLTGDLVNYGALWDLTEFVRQSEEMAWDDLLSFFREELAVYESRVRLIPLDGDSLLLFYRKDLFDHFGMQAPRTWDEYTATAEFFHGKPFGPNNTAIFGSCVSRIRKCSNAYWASLVLSSMTQTGGSSSGFLFDPNNMNPLLGEAFDETLRFMDDQAKYGHGEEFTGGCLNPNDDINTGRCAMTYNWGNTLSGSDIEYLPYGITRTPGSTKVLNRSTMKLVNCTLALCPHGQTYDDIGRVNYAPYAAFGGWSAIVSNFVPDGKKLAIANFFAWLSNPNQSIYDVIPNPARVTSFPQPYRRSHLMVSKWLEIGNFDIDTAEQFTSATRQINDPNAVIELRIPASSSFRDVFEDEIYDFLAGIHVNSTVVDNLTTRQAITARIDKRFREIIDLYDDEFSENRLIDSYQRSLGAFLDKPRSMNLIGDAWRWTGWGIAALVCLGAILLLSWIWQHQDNRVIKSSQVISLMMICVGIFVIGLAIVLLGFDDQLFDLSTLNITCQSIPWVYLFGFSMFISPMIAKIRQFRLVYLWPEDNTEILVPTVKFCWSFILIFGINGTLLATWTAIDPLKWERLEVEGQRPVNGRLPDTFGRCASKGTNFVLFVSLLAAFNLSLCVISIYWVHTFRQMKIEFHEIRWMIMGIVSFSELWAIGGPILLLVNSDPVGLFLVLVLIMSVSAATVLLCIFFTKYKCLKKRTRKKRDEAEVRVNALRHSSVFQTGESSSDLVSSRLSGPRVFNPVIEEKRRLTRLNEDLVRVLADNTLMEEEIRSLTGRRGYASRSLNFRFSSNASLGSTASCALESALANLRSIEVPQSRDPNGGPGRMDDFIIEENVQEDDSNPTSNADRINGVVKETQVPEEKEEKRIDSEGGAATEKADDDVDGAVGDNTGDTKAGS